MKMSVAPVLVELRQRDKTLITISATLISDKYIIITHHILTAFLENTHVYINNLKPGLHDPELLIENASQLKFSIVTSDNTTFSKLAKLLYFFTCDDIINSSNGHLLDSDETDELSHKLSIFFVLGFENLKADDVKADLGMLWHRYCRIKFDISDRMYVISCPFGLRHFVGTYSEGSVANIIGKNKCFVLTDCPTVSGSEGSPMYLKLNKTPIGIVLASLNSSKGEWLGLTMGVPFSIMLSQFAPQKLHLHLRKRNKLMENVNKCLAVVSTFPRWGTGILLSKAKGIFITNFHVVENENKANIIWNNTHLKAAVVFRTSEDDLYDLAILKCTDDSLATLKNLEMQDIELYTGSLQQGSEVFAAGFPIFSREQTIGPTVTTGHISQISKTMLTTSCTVIAGHSGGAILTPEGLVIGMITCNLKDEDSGVIFPRINLAIPMCAIWDALKNFVLTENTNQLMKLVSHQEEKSGWWTIKSKL